MDTYQLILYGAIVLELLAVLVTVYLGMVARVISVTTMAMALLGVAVLLAPAYVVAFWKRQN